MVVIVVIVPFVVTVIAGAGILLVVAGRAIGQVQVKLLDHRLGVGSWLDLYNHRKIIAFRKCDIGEQNIAFLFQRHAGRVGSAATGDADSLFADRDRFPIFSERGDLDFAILGDEELEMGLDCVEDAAAVGTGFGVIVVVVMAFVFFVLVVLFVGLQRGCAEGEGEHGRECREGFQCEVGFLFHGWFSVFWIWLWVG